MDPPDPDLATHLIRITPAYVDRLGYSMDVHYRPEDATAYIGEVEQSSQAELDPGIVYSVNMFTVVIFAMDDPGIQADQGVTDRDGKPVPTQALAEWGLIPAGFALPEPGAPGPIDLPDGWRPEKTALVLADSNSLDNGVWVTRAEARS
jgi:hypothetical protein